MAVVLEATAATEPAVVLRVKGSSGRMEPAEGAHLQLGWPFSRPFFCMVRAARSAQGRTGRRRGEEVEDVDGGGETAALLWVAADDEREAAPEAHDLPAAIGRTPSGAHHWAHTIGRTPLKGASELSVCSRRVTPPIPLPPPALLLLPAASFRPLAALCHLPCPAYRPHLPCSPAPRSSCRRADLLKGSGLEQGRLDMLKAAGGGERTCGIETGALSLYVAFGWTPGEPPARSPAPPPPAPASPLRISLQLR